jgi:hypothetical protein
LLRCVLACERRHDVSASPKGEPGSFILRLVPRGGSPQIEW